MPRECAFCPNTANLTGEHLWSDWLNELLPGRKRFNLRNEKREVVKTWTSPELNWKAKVVCNSCNSGWMSKLENEHAKPSLTDLIIGKSGVLIDDARARSIALFAFKTAVVFDHLMRRPKRFFDFSARSEFRNSLTIPPGVGVFIAAIASRGFGEANTLYRELDLPSPRFFEAYVLTYSIERVAIQVAACKTSGISAAKVKNYFAVPIWPKAPEDFTWPPRRAISTTAEFDEFSDRWKTITADTV
jgi:hypothetical protein